MLEKVKDIFDQQTFLSPNDLLGIVSISRLKQVKKGEQLANAGEVNYLVHFVIKGLLRHYVIDENGNEKTMRFVSEKQSAGCMESIFHNRPSFESIEALENSLIIIFDNRKAEKLALKSMGLLKLQNISIKKALVEAVERLRNHTILNPKDRYELFCEKHPRLEQRIKQKYLASYLGITPTSLSRMRARAMK
jgi:CRP-like cAMP-binding protein